MKTQAYRTAVAILSTLVLCWGALGCGSRTGDYGEDPGTGGTGGTDCRSQGESCAIAAECCGGECDGGICGAVCAPDGSTCGNDGDCCNGQCDAGTCGTTECRRADESCDATGQCCDDLLCGNGFCRPPTCSQNGELCAGAEACCSGNCDDTGRCAPACAPDGAMCVVPSNCCGGQCEGGVCGGSPDCSHGECDEGSKLAATCSPCTALVCNNDAFCCDSFWDSACVEGAEILCGLPCAQCSPNGSMCFDSEECCSGDCQNGQCAGPCLPNGSQCNVPGACCSGQCNNGACGPGGDCSHDECTDGNALDPMCTPCVAQVCAQDNFCCQQAWDEICVSLAEQLCGLNCNNCSQDGSPCNAAAECCSNQCTNNVCGGGCFPDGQPCAAPNECCSNQCTNNVCGGDPGCTHTECEEGAALSAACTPCVADVCNVDDFCCSVNWDSICVDEAEQICGLNCTNCTPDGGMCNFDPECCGGSCDNNICGTACSPDGDFCFAADECCGNQCNNNVCGSQPSCPSDGSPCGDCVANNCCSELQTCFGSPTCITDVLCFQNCVSNGNGLPTCFFQCISSAEAFGVVGCLAQSCNGACF